MKLIEERTTQFLMALSYAPDPFVQGKLVKWADLMERKLAEGNKLTKEIVRDTADTCDMSDIDEDSAMFASFILCSFWVHGGDFVILQLEWLTSEESRAL